MAKFDSSHIEPKNPIWQRVLKNGIKIVIPFGQFSNKFYEHLKGFHDLKTLIIKDLLNNPLRY